MTLNFRGQNEKIDYDVCVFCFCCTTTSMKNKEDRGWQDFSRLDVDLDTQQSVREKLGSPTEVSERIDKKLNKKIEQWVYKKDNSPKFFAVFVDGVLRSTFMSVWESEKESNLNELLSKFSGDWKVIPEPITNPHAMPTMCYLVDEDNGRRIKVHGHKMVVEFVSKWAPKILITKDLSKPKRPEFCIADVCAKVSEGNKWNTNHCDQLSVWLKQFNNNRR